MLNDLVIRLATPDDAASIAALSRDAIERGLDWRWQPARILRAIRRPDVNVAVAGEPGAVVAFGIMSYSDDEAHLQLFAVHERLRRQGVGTALLHWLEDVARVAGAKRIRLEARRDNDAARCFYNEHGYHERGIRRGMYADSVDGVRLEKWLAAATS